LLAQHDDISTIGELKATRMGDISRYYCSCGKLIRECDFWEQVCQLAVDSGIQFSVDHFDTVYTSDKYIVDKIVRATVRGPRFEQLRSAVLAAIPDSVKRTQEISARNFVLSHAICEIQGGDIFLDGSKDPTRLVHFLRSGLWDIDVIHLQRDGRAVCNSIRKHDGKSYVDAISYWRKIIKELSHMRRRLDGERVFDLNYEDLCSKPKESLDAICDWLCIDRLGKPEIGVIANEKNHILGNKMRLGKVAEVRLDDSWKRALSRDDRENFLRYGQKLNRTLGYA
jgi:hypothetical protein